MTTDKTSDHMGLNMDSVVTFEPKSHISKPLMVRITSVLRCSSGSLRPPKMLCSISSLT